MGSAVAIVVDNVEHTVHIGQMTSEIVEDSEEKDADVVGTACPGVTGRVERLV